MKSYRDHTLGAKERASLLLKEMSLDEKMAQINCVFPFDHLMKWLHGREKCRRL